MPDTGFLPSRNGLAFTNSWPHEPAVEVKVPRVGTVPIGDASNGLCGGMVFLALDIFTAGGDPPSAPQPDHGTPLFNYVVRRLVKSWDVPNGVVKYFQWMNTPDADVDLWMVKHHGVAWRTIEDEWPKVKRDLDNGTPCPLGLVTVHSHNPNDLAKNHQVLAWGYEQAGNLVTIKVYDPNTPRADGDAVSITMDTSEPSNSAGIKHGINIGHDVRGFFRVGYKPSAPPH
jgi:hypothetical protein